jgi:hypothetical protein
LHYLLAILLLIPSTYARAHERKDVFLKAEIIANNSAKISVGRLRGIQGGRVTRSTLHFKDSFCHSNINLLKVSSALCARIERDWHCITFTSASNAETAQKIFA